MPRIWFLLLAFLGRWLSLPDKRTHVCLYGPHWQSIDTPLALALSCYFVSHRSSCRDTPSLVGRSWQGCARSVAKPFSYQIGGQEVRHAMLWSVSPAQPLMKRALPALQLRGSKRKREGREKETKETSKSVRGLDLVACLSRRKGCSVSAAHACSPVPKTPKS